MKLAAAAAVLGLAACGGGSRGSRVPALWAIRAEAAQSARQDERADDDASIWRD